MWRDERRAAVVSFSAATAKLCSRVSLLKLSTAAAERTYACVKTSSSFLSSHKQTKDRDADGSHAFLFFPPTHPAWGLRAKAAAAGAPCTS